MTASEKRDHARISGVAKAKQTSLSEAAVKLKLSRRTLQEWEQGRATPRHFALEGLREKIRHSSAANR
jgi:DNA-binding transcriptional regulator YiaG